MSRNTISVSGPSGLSVFVAVGWDRPLGEIFANVLPDEDDEADYSDVIFRNFESAQDVADALSAVGLSLPQSVIDALASDVASQAGNVIREFSSSGELIAEHAPVARSEAGSE